MIDNVCDVNMSEELTQKGLLENGLILGNYEYYNIGNTTLKQLKKAKIIPNEDYEEYEKRRPDALLVDRSSPLQIKILAVIEFKDPSKFQTTKDQIYAIEECNDLCQVLNATVGIATDNSAFIWFNPKHDDPSNEYPDRTKQIKRSYSRIKDEKDFDYISEFIINQSTAEPDPEKLEPTTLSSIKNLDLVCKHLSFNNSTLEVDAKLVDATKLSKEIWQDLWSVTGATPEKCLYTFLELFIFKYLSDLAVISEDSSGNKVNFSHILELGPPVSLKNYSQNVLPFLKEMFPESDTDHTTIVGEGLVLNPDVIDHGVVFHKILKKFEAFGKLKNLNPNFKSKVFEEFMKQSISKKDLGQFFTPRNIIEAILRISDIEKLESNSVICDPACGVGGFILEPLKTIANGVDFYYPISGNEINPRHKMIGFDKGFEDEEKLTIILAKANMLIFLSELLKNNIGMSKNFAKLFNSTFKLFTTTILGTLSQIEYNKYDLILTNPPYVTSGSSNFKIAIRNEARYRNFYKINGLGKESLFLEWIINSLKPGKKAFVVIPDGIVNRNDSKLRDFIIKECIIDGIISLPVNTFYTTSKKTYILAITKKNFTTSTTRQQNVQSENVFTYLISNVGETLDVNRFPIPENNLGEMVSLFNQFKGAKDDVTFKNKPRCKIQPFEKFDPKNHWAVDRWWTRAEQVDLGIEEEEAVVSLEEFTEITKDLEITIHGLSEELEKFK